MENIPNNHIPNRNPRPSRRGAFPPPLNLQPLGSGGATQPASASNQGSRPAPPLGGTRPSPLNLLDQHGGIPGSRAHSHEGPSRNFQPPFSPIHLPSVSEETVSGLPDHHSRPPAQGSQQAPPPGERLSRLHPRPMIAYDDFNFPVQPEPLSPFHLNPPSQNPNAAEIITNAPQGTRARPSNTSLGGFSFRAPATSQEAQQAPPANAPQSNSRPGLLARTLARFRR